MSLLRPADLVSMRGVLQESLSDTAVIERQSFTDDLGGGGTMAWGAAGTFDCRVAPLAQRTEGGVVADRVSEDADWLITFPANTTIDTDDRIVVGSRTFEVRAVRGPRSDEVSRRVEANERA